MCEIVAIGELYTCTMIIIIIIGYTIVKIEWFVSLCLVYGFLARAE